MPDQVWINPPEDTTRSEIELQYFPSRRERAILRATLDTYHWMRDQMMPKLERALDNRERPYYDAVAKSIGST